MKNLDVLAVMHVSTVHAWTDNRIHYRECLSLANAGYRVSLIAQPSAKEGQMTAVAVTQLARRARVFRMVLTPMQGIVKALQSDAAVIHLHDPELIPYIPILRLMGRTVIYDAHEDLPEQLQNKPYIPKLWLPVFRSLSRVLLRVAKTSDLIICATEKIEESFAERNTEVVHNYPPIRPVDQVENSVFDRKDAAVYIGGISLQRGALVMLDAAKHFPRGWTLRLAGPCGADLDSSVTSDSNDHCIYHGFLSSDGARDLLLDAKVGLVLFTESNAHRAALPTKMFEYFAAGVPVIASDFPLWRKILGDRHCGLVVDPESPAQVAEAVKRYAEDPTLLDEHSRNARRAAEQEFNWDREAIKLIESYRALTIARGRKELC